MKFLIKPYKGIWVAVKDNINKKTLKERILDSDVCISDLDDTDAPSPAKKLAYSKLVSKKIFDPKFISWCLRTGFKLITKGKKVEHECWKEYVDKFLTNPYDLKEIKEKYNSEKVAKSLYPGVKEFYDLLPNVFKSYFTRNIPEIANAFGKFLGFDEVIPKAFDKRSLTLDFIERRPFFKNYIVRGDSPEDEEIVDVLEFYQSQGKIKNVISIYRADSPLKLNERFTVNVGKNSFGLVKIIKE